MFVVMLVFVDTTICKCFFLTDFLITSNGNMQKEAENRIFYACQFKPFRIPTIKDAHMFVG